MLTITKMTTTSGGATIEISLVKQEKMIVHAINLLILVAILL